jgi:hypothetical protein
MLMPSVLIIEDDEDGRRAIARLFTRQIGKYLRPPTAIPEWNSPSRFMQSPGDLGIPSF